MVAQSRLQRARRALVVRERESADQLDVLVASCLVLARTAVRTSPPHRSTLAAVVRRMAEAIADLAPRPGDRPARQRAADRALDLAQWVVDHGAAVPAQSPLAAACAGVRLVATDVMVFAGVEPAEAFDALHARFEAGRGPDGGDVGAAAHPRPGPAAPSPGGGRPDDPAG